MIKNLLKLLVVVVIGILIYNYFLGTPSEKENAQKIFGEVKELGVAVKDLLANEKEKFDAGKYDNALDKIGDIFSSLKEKAGEIDEKYIDRISELEKKRQDLEKQLDKAKKDSGTEAGDQDIEKLNQDLKKLMEDTESIMNELQEN